MVCLSSESNQGAEFVNGLAAHNQTKRVRIFSVKRVVKVVVVPHVGLVFIVRSVNIVTFHVLVANFFIFAIFFVLVFNPEQLASDGAPSAKQAVLVKRCEESVGTLLPNQVHVFAETANETHHVPVRQGNHTDLVQRLNHGQRVVCPAAHYFTVLSPSSIANEQIYKLAIEQSLKLHRCEAHIFLISGEQLGTRKLELVLFVRHLNFDLVLVALH